MSHRVAAVSVLKADPVHGVVRFLQDGDSTTVTVSWFFCGCLVWWWCLGCKGGKEKGGGGGTLEIRQSGGVLSCAERERRSRAEAKKDGGVVLPVQSCLGWVPTISHALSASLKTVGLFSPLQAEFSGLKPGKHGFHIHEFGNLTDGNSLAFFCWVKKTKNHRLHQRRWPLQPLRQDPRQPRR